MDLNALTLKANAGDLEACYELAMMYKTGQHVLQNDQVYEKYIKMASAKNHPKALLELGFILVAADKLEEGIDKIKLSAKKGYIEANYYAGQIYFGRLYNQVPNYKLGFKYFETYMVEFEPQTFQFLSDFDPRLFSSSDSELERLIVLYEKYQMPMGLYHAALYHLELKKPNYEKALEDLQIAHKKGLLLATHRLFLLYYDHSPLYPDFPSKDFAKATTYYVLLLNANYKPNMENDGQTSFFIPPKGGYLETLFDYNKYVEDYKTYIFQSISYDTDFSSKIRDIKIIPEIILDPKPLMFYTGTVEVYKEKPKKKKAVEVITKEVSYKNFSERPDSKLSVLSERAIFSKLNIASGICVFNPYEPENQVLDALNKQVEKDKASYKDLLVDSKIVQDYAYQFSPSLKLRFKHLDETYETNLTPKDIQEGMLLEGPLKDDVKKQINKVERSMAKPKSGLYTIFNILLLLSLVSMIFLYFDKLESTLGLIMSGSSLLYVVLVYSLSKVLPKKIQVLSKTQLIKMNDSLDFKKALKVKRSNQSKKRLPILLSILGILLALALVADIYLDILNLV